MANVKSEVAEDILLGKARKGIPFSSSARMPLLLENGVKISSSAGLTLEEAGTENQPDAIVNEEVLLPSDNPSVNESIPPPEVSNPAISRIPEDLQSVSAMKPTPVLAVTLATLPGITSLPITLPGVDFCGSLHVPVDDGHSVILLLLAKQATSDFGFILVTPDGIRPKFPTADTIDLKSLQADVSALTAQAAKLQGDIAQEGPLAEQVITFLSGRELSFLAPHDPIEAVTGPGGRVLGYFQSEHLVQFVVVAALTTKAHVEHYLRVQYPMVPGGGVDTYLLPAGADLTSFARYLTAKNAAGWRGQKAKLLPSRLLGKRSAFTRSLTWGGTAASAYAFAAGLLGRLIPALLPILSFIAPAILGAILASTLGFWFRARQGESALHRGVVQCTSWRLAQFTPSDVDQALAKLTSVDAMQLRAELRPEETLSVLMQEDQQQRSPARAPEANGKAGPAEFDNDF